MPCLCSFLQGVAGASDPMLILQLYGVDKIIFKHFPKSGSPSGQDSQSHSYLKGKTQYVKKHPEILGISL